MYNSILYAKFNLMYCKNGMQENNERHFIKNISRLKLKSVYFINIILETFSLSLLKIYIKKKKIAKYLEIIPKLLTKKQRVRRTLGFLKKYWKLFSLERYVVQKEKFILYKTIYKNRLNFKRWK